MIWNGEQWFAFWLTFGISYTGIKLAKAELEHKRRQARQRARWKRFDG